MLCNKKLRRFYPTVLFFPTNEIWYLCSPICRASTRQILPSQSQGIRHISSSIPEAMWFWYRVADPPQFSNQGRREMKKATERPGEKKKIPGKVTRAPGLLERSSGSEPRTARREGENDIGISTYTRWCRNLLKKKGGRKWREGVYRHNLKMLRSASIRHR